jgi:hypothetical protein
VFTYSAGMPAAHLLFRMAAVRFVNDSSISRRWLALLGNGCFSAALVGPVGLNVELRSE